jgi:NAD(P)H-dependent flavin oxidoreductase YrpB (nitropropane dioxygenase family)
MTALGTPPLIIQGGMGAAVSNWVLARATALRGQLGVVSGTGIDTVLVRRLQDGDAGGHMRSAMAQFPIPGVSEETLERHFLPDGRPEGTPYRALPLHKAPVSRARQLLTVLANFVEVRLAKEGHDGPVGINLLTKIQIPTLASLYGAMLAGVDYVLMGAGIPREIPGILDRFAEQQPASLKLEVEGLHGAEARHLELDPKELWPEAPAAIRRPQFLAIIASNLLATILARKASGRVDGFVVEGPTAGGHNAPPRGETTFNERAEPVYGERDVVDLAKVKDLGLPFWVAGGAGSPVGLAEALAAGAAGIQVGTLFAFCDESGLKPQYKREVLASAVRGEVDVLTDGRASPTGYPFKVVKWTGGAPAGPVRERVCDMGYLRTPYIKDDGKIGFRCASEPEDAYLKKGGLIEDTVGRQCLCNALMANIGLGQVRDEGFVEPPILTAGDDLKGIAKFLGGRERYSAGDVLDYLLQGSDRSWVMGHA